MISPLGERPLESFYRLLVEDSTIREALRKELGERTDAVRRAIADGQTLSDDDQCAYDIIAETLRDEADEVLAYSVEGSYGEYPVTIRGLGGVFFVQAPEFDDAGFFPSVEEASEYVELNWDTSLRE